MNRTVHIGKYTAHGFLSTTGLVWRSEDDHHKRGVVVERTGTCGKGWLEQRVSGVIPSGSYFLLFV